MKCDIMSYIVKDLKKVLVAYAKTKPHLVLIGIDLPYRNGYYWCKQIRKSSNIPIIFMSSHTCGAERILAFNSGGDDCIEIPLFIDALLWTIQSILRRVYVYSESKFTVITYSDFILDLEKAILTCCGSEVLLTRNECNILSLLIKASGELVSKTQIIQELWKDESFINHNTLSVNINRLRKKMKFAQNKECIETINRKGYRLL